MRLNNETKIGILVAGVVVLLLTLTVKAGDFRFVESGYTIKAHFNQIDGVELNAPVRFNGLEMGRVKDIRILYGQQTVMEVVLWLKDQARLRQGARAFVKNMGLLGEKYIGLSDGDSGAPFLEAGSVIEGSDPVDFEKLLVKGQEIGDNLKEITANLNERLKVNSQSIDEIIANLNVSMRHVTSISRNLDERLAVNREAIDNTMGNLSVTSKNLVELTEDLKVNPWKLLYREKKKGVVSPVPSQVK